jgi:uncharacterized SAM-binding protein YcdF (DUF218 family)
MSFSKRSNWQQGGAIGSLIALLFLIALCLLLYWARHPIMRYAAESWIVDAPAAHADAILLLGDDNFYADRATRAAELIRQGAAPLVVASGRRMRPSASITDLEQHDLIERGVPKEKILVFAHDADSTAEEAGAIARFSTEHHFRSVILVTSNYHTRRARYIFEKSFPSSIAISTAAARDGDFDPDHWWEKRRSEKLFVHELTGMLVAMWDFRSVSRSEQ